MHEHVTEEIDLRCELRRGWHVENPELLATEEHVTEIIHIREIPAREVESRKFVAEESTAHVLDF